jgi:hypothetical protein
MVAASLASSWSSRLMLSRVPIVVPSL